MSVASHDWAGPEWQEFCTLLLYRHHDGQYQPIPDQDQGDGGLEGFSTDGKGCGYQCYAPKASYGIAERRDQQVNKIKRTVNRLIENREVLVGLVGQHVVHDVRFLFPVCESRKLVSEVRAQERKLRDAVTEHALTWISEGVVISVHQGNELLAREMAELERTGAMHARLPQVDVEDDVINTHLREAAEELTGATGKLTDRFSAAAAPELLRTVLTDHLVGKELAAHLSATNPQIYEEYSRLVAERRARIHRESLEGTTANRTLTQISDELADAIVASVPGVHHDDARKLAQSAVADWLIECPLRFSVGAAA